MRFSFYVLGQFCRLVLEGAGSYSSFGNVFLAVYPLLAPLCMLKDGYWWWFQLYHDLPACFSAFAGGYVVSLKWDLHISCSFSPAAFALFTIALSLWSFSSAVLPQLKMPSVSIPSTVCCSSNSPNGSLQKQHFSKGVCSLHKREQCFLNTADVSSVDCQIFSFGNTFLLQTRKSIPFYIVSYLLGLYSSKRFFILVPQKSRSFLILMILLVTLWFIVNFSFWFSSRRIWDSTAFPLVLLTVSFWLLVVDLWLFFGSLVSWLSN